jgi:hypothetical protein
MAYENAILDFQDGNVSRGRRLENTFRQICHKVRQRASRLQGYGTFEDYCRERWGLARRTAYQLMDAAEVVDNVRNCAQQLPANEAQARPLTGLDPDVYCVSGQTPARLDQ